MARKAVRKITGSEPKRVSIVLDDTRATVTPRDQKIPPVVYQTFSTRLLDYKHHDAVMAIRQANQDLTFEFFDDTAVQEYMATRWGADPIYPVFLGSRFPQMKSDIFRYCLVFDRGGYYLDINKGITKSLTSFHPVDAEGIISFESNHTLIWPPADVLADLNHPDKVVLQWAFGFSPGHPILERTIRKIVDYSTWVSGKKFRSVRDGVVGFTGPGAFTTAVWDTYRKGQATGILDAGIDFDGHGIFRLPGSTRTPLASVHYTSLSDQHILDLP